MLGVPIGRKAFAEVEARCAFGNRIEQERRHDGADDLGDDVGNNLPGGKATASGQSHSHRGVEMASGHMADRIGHCHHGKAEGERNSEQPDADLRKGGSRGDPA